MTASTIDQRRAIWLGGQAEADAALLPVPVPQPAQVRATPVPLAVTRSALLYSLAVDPLTPLLPAVTKELHVDPSNRTGNASDANPGTSRAAPLLTIPAARAKVNADGCAIRIFGLTGDFIVRETAPWPALAFTHQIVNESWPNRLLLCRTASAAPPAWAATSNYPGVYEIAANAATDVASIVDFANKVDMAARVQVPVGGTVADRDRWRAAVARCGGAFHRPVQVASLAAVAVTPGSTFYDAAAKKLYVQAIDSRNLVGDTRMQPLSNGVFGRGPANAANKLLYLKCLDFFGGSPGLYFNTNGFAGGLMITDTCTMQASANQGGVTNGSSAVGAGAVIHYRAGFWFNWTDGSGYSSGLGTNFNDPTPTALELECAFGGNGMTGSTDPSSNASTSHNAGDIVTHNCVIVDSSDRPLADVHNSRRWVIGGYVGAPVGNDGASLANYGIADQVIAMLDGVQFGPAQPGKYHLRAENAAQLLYRNLSPLVTFDPTSNGQFVRM